MSTGTRPAARPDGPQPAAPGGARGGRAGWVAGLRLVGALGLLVAVVALFAPAFVALVEGKGEPMELPAVPAAPGAPTEILLLVRSSPAGATVSLGGQEHGVTPTIFSASCRLGEPLRLSLRKSGFVDAAATVACTADAPREREVAVRLQRAPR